MHPIDPTAALVLTDADVLRLDRLALAGLPAVGRLDGGVTETDRALVEALHRAARQARDRLRSRSQAGRATRVAPDTAPGASSSTSWPTCSEAARQYGVDASYLRRRAAEGALRAKVGVKGEYRLDPDGLVEWAASRGATSHTKAA